MEEAMEAGPSFVELSLKGKISAALQWRSVVVRPVTIKRIVMLQVWQGVMSTPIST
jgi:hypothetical protein